MHSSLTSECEQETCAQTWNPFLCVPPCYQPVRYCWGKGFTFAWSLFHSGKGKDIGHKYLTGRSLYCDNKWLQRESCAKKHCNQHHWLTMSGALRIVRALTFVCTFYSVLLGVGVYVYAFQRWVSIVGCANGLCVLCLWGKTHRHFSCCDSKKWRKKILIFKPKGKNDG